MLAIRLRDPRESNLPDVGPLLVADAETGEQLYVDTGDRGFRRRFAEASARREAEIATSFARAGVDALALSTDEDLVRAIVRMATPPAPSEGLTDVLSLAGRTCPAPADPGRDRPRPATRRAAPRATGGRGDGFVAGDRRRSGSLGTAQARIPPAILLAGIALAIVALARPQAEVSVPRQEGVVVLAFDVSGSMAATDLQPTRMEAARAAAKAFVERQPAGVVIGIVAFSDGGISVQTPTRDQSAVLSAIDRLEPQQGTSLGQGILAAVHTIDVALNPPPTDYYSNRSPEPTAAPTPVPAGVHAPAVVVLLSDGENNENPIRSRRRRPRQTAGSGSIPWPSGARPALTSSSTASRVHTQLNKDLLDQIATTTGGTSNEAADSASLLKVYDTLDTKLS